MWASNIQFDTGLFTLLYVLLTYTRQCCINFFNMAIRDVLNYIAAERRIRVRFLKLTFDERFVLFLGVSFT